MTGSGTLTAPPACNNFSLSAGGQAFSPAGGTGFVNVTAPQSCTWNTSDAPSWVSVTTQGTGPTNLSYFVASNSGAARTATMTIAGVPFVVEQQANSASGLGVIGSCRTWQRRKTGPRHLPRSIKPTPATARLSFFGDAADPSGIGPLTLPLAFPQQSAAALSGPPLAHLHRTLAR